MVFKHRKEIDGLRAVAVLSVLVYHAEFQLNGASLFPGGFLGVDVFFVISGYLIASIILRELSEGTFSLRSFYERRIRRILPALYLVTMTTLPLAWLTMLPKAFKEFAGSALSVVAFVSNIWFWREDSYTAEPSALKPLLHTWSLGVEEQFYLFFPLILILLWKVARSWLIPVLGLSFLLSLQLAEMESGKNIDAAFYLLPFRWWELMAGALMASVELKYGRKLAPAYERWLAPAGLVILIASMALLDDSVRHPSYMTLWTIAGTALIVWGGGGSDIATRLLTLKPVVYIGLISYSLYLWHFPLLAFARILLDGLSAPVAAVLLGVSVILAALTYRYVEQPARQRGRVRFFPLAAGLGGLCVMIVASNLYIYLTNGAEYRLAGTPAFADFRSAEQVRLESEETGTDYSTGEKVRRCYNRDPGSSCRFGDERILVIGDSYAAQYEHQLKAALTPYGHGLRTLTFGECPFISDKFWFGKNDKCPQLNRLRQEALSSYDASHVVFISLNTRLFFTARLADGASADPKIVADEFRNTLISLLGADRKVVLVTTPPLKNNTLFNEWQQSLLSLRSMGETVSFTETYDETTYKEAKDLEGLLGFENIEDQNLLIISAPEILCRYDGRKCLNTSKTGSVYNHTNHLSAIGAQIILDEALIQMRQKGWL